MITPLTVTRPRAKAPRVLERVNRPPSSERRRDPGRTQLNELLHGRRDLGPCTVEQNFADEHLGLIRAGNVLPLEHLVVVTGERDAIIEQADDGNVLTGCYRKENDCRLIFRYAYRRIRCTVRTLCETPDVHLGFLNHVLKEVQTLEIKRPKSNCNDASGSLWTTLDFHAEPLYEIQGIAWRGGILQISGITLIP